MSRDHRFIFPLPNGLHARPASHLEAVTSRFASEISLVNERTRRSANAKSVLSMVGADVKRDDPCVVRISGSDEEAAWAAVTTFLREVFPRCDDTSSPPLPPEPGEWLVPRSLKAAGLCTWYRGVVASRGIGWGKTVIANGFVLPEDLERQQARDLRKEKDRFTTAIATLRATTEARIAASSHAHEIGVLRAHLSIISDVALADKVHQLIEQDGRTAPQAVVAAGEFFIATLRESQSAYLRERVLDVQDVCTQLLGAICGHSHKAPALRLVEPSVCVADHLTPGQLLALDRKLLRGLVLRQGGTTSHTLILARSMSVPTLVGVQEALSLLRAGQEVIVDANLGLLVPQVSEPIRKYYKLETRRLAAMQQRLASSRKSPAVTRDGQHLEIAANVASAEEVQLAVENGAEGVGLFRTEMLFLDRESPPTEEEQFETYARAARSAGKHGVIIRLLDIGGDKPLRYLKLAEEANPFLGYRGVRIYGEHGTLIRTQMRAILRAAAEGNVRILVPMVCCLEEVRSVRQMMGQARDELAAEGVSCERVPPLGVMLEVPSTAFILDELCQEADFFSIGSNDLAQYFLAADRDNRRVASIHSWSHPSFLRLLKKIVDEVRSHGKWVGLCGEMADDAAAVPLLVGLGLDEISLPSPGIPAVKQAIGALRASRCVKLLDEALRCASRSELEALLDGFAADGRDLPLLSPDLILNSSATSEAEVIKELTDRLWLSGRTDQPHLIEEAVWQREDKYSTGFGHGFALPHCKSDSLGANSIALAKLATPVPWGGAEKTPVDVVILLAIRARDHDKEHMRIFSRLSRLVMREEFRHRIRQDSDPRRLQDFLEESLGLRAAVA